MESDTVLHKGTQIRFSDEIANRIKIDILKTIDQICEDQGLTYFAFGPTLVGCVHYQNFIPDSNTLSADIGLLREDYEELVSFLRKRADEYHLILDEFVGFSPIPQRLLRVGRIETIESNDATITQDFWVNLSPFDALPDSFDLYCAQLRRMKRANARLENCVATWKYNRQTDRFIPFAIKKVLYGRRSMKKAFDRIQRIAQRYNGNPDAHRLARTVFRKSEVVWYDQIFPVKRMPFGDMMLSCPNDYSPWTEKFTPKLTKQIKSIQKVDLILLREFDRICRKLDIGYFICGGSMLGYVRHGGFIPWDDDIDVGMLRADYDRFLKEGGKELGDRFFLQTRQSDPKIPYLFSKIRMNNTEYITEYNEHRDFHKGICLDLFPFDALPNDEKEQKEFLAKVFSRVRKHNLACNKQIAEPVYDTPPKSFEDWFYRNLAKAHRMLWRMVSIKRTQKRYLKVATKYNAKAEELGLTTVASFVPTYTFIDKDLLLPYQDITFEGVPAKIPRCPEKFLEMQYNDFMQLPPIHQQLGHDLIRWSADIPELKEDDEDDGKEKA